MKTMTCLGYHRFAHGNIQHFVVVQSVLGWNISLSFFNFTHSGLSFVWVRPNLMLLAFEYV